MDRRGTLLKKVFINKKIIKALNQGFDLEKPNKKERNPKHKKVHTNAAWLLTNFMLMLKGGVRAITETNNPIM